MNDAILQSAKERYDFLLQKFNEQVWQLRLEFPSVVPFFKYHYNEVNGLRTISIKELQIVSDERKEEMLKRTQDIEDKDFITMNIEVEKPQE